MSAGHFAKDGPLDQIAPSEIDRIVITAPSNLNAQRGWGINVYRRNAEYLDEGYVACTRQAALATAACLLAGVKVPSNYSQLTEVPHEAR